MKLDDLYNIGEIILNDWSKLNITINYSDNNNENQEDYYNFLKNLPINEIKIKNNNNDFDINNIIKDYIDQYKDKDDFIFFMLLPDTNYNSVYNGFYQFYKDLKILDSINDGYKFLDLSTNDGKKKIMFGNIFVFIIYKFSTIFNNNTSSLEETYKNNPLIFFYICSYLFFDYLLDDPNIDKEIKKKICKYVYKLFASGKNVEDTQLIDPVYLTTINNLFIILFNYKKKRLSAFI